jgi:membrane-bound metal-dependent hydrolase YbcI (DUF457 family)
MPSHRAHELFGLAVWIFFLVFLLVTYAFDFRRIAFAGAVGFCFCFLGSILPDIDEKNSRIFRNVRFLLGVIVFVAAFALLSAKARYRSIEAAAYTLALAGLVALAAVVLLHALIPEHRAGIHSFKAAAVYGVFAMIFSYLLTFELYTSAAIAAFGFGGYASHLVLDGTIK